MTRAAIDGAGVPAEAIDHLVFGQVIPTSPRVVSIEAGIPKETPALTVNRLCGSGLQAIVSAANTLVLGDGEIAIGGGAEAMSRAPFFAPHVRYGQKMGDAILIDGLSGALEDPFDKVLMGVTAENVAERYGVTREQQDVLALESQKRAARAIAEGRFASQIVPIKVQKRRETVAFEVDEHVRADATIEELAKLRTIFRKEGGTVTAGNAPGINDGAAAVVLATDHAIKKHGLMPSARLVSYAHAGVEPAFMGIGPVQRRARRWRAPVFAPRISTSLVQRSLCSSGLRRV